MKIKLSELTKIIENTLLEYKKINEEIVIPQKYKFEIINWWDSLINDIVDFITEIFGDSNYVTNNLEKYFEILFDSINVYVIVTVENNIIKDLEITFEEVNVPKRYKYEIKWAEELLRRKFEIKKKFLLNKRFNKKLVIQKQRIYKVEKLLDLRII